MFHFSQLPLKLWLGTELVVDLYSQKVNLFLNKPPHLQMASLFKAGKSSGIYNDIILCVGKLQ